MLPIFPLELVVYPGERLALHIFEKRYQQLIDDCEQQGISFGIPTYKDKKLQYGTEVILKKIEKRYPDGESDIICLGTRVFKINEFYSTYPNKLYAGAEVEYLDDNKDSAKELQEELLKNITVLYVELTLDKPPVFEIPFMSYQVAHKIGLSIDQEYHLLTIRSELERLSYLIAHLKLAIPVVKQMNRAKIIIEMNGHFKNFDPLDFKEFTL